MEGISVIICSYNGASRLPETIRHLALQEVEKIFWEIILVDNASNDDTSNIARKEWSKYANKSVGFKVVEEKRPGKTFALQKGIETTSFQFIIICDDDNWLSPNYVNFMFSLLKKNPVIGAVGTRSIPYYQAKPPEWFEANEIFFAIGSQGEPGDITNSKGYVWGAGAAFRKQILTKIKKLGYSNILTDRSGNKMTTGGDVEMCFVLRLLGYKIYYTEKCYIHHYMPASRFDPRKFIDLSYQNGFSTKYLELLYKKSFLSKKELIIKIKNILKRAPKRYLILRNIGKKNFDKEVMLKGWQGEVKGWLFILRNHQKLKNNFNRLYAENK
jgi:glycosyltransferase involved in cell wall biosynthesis